MRTLFVPLLLIVCYSCHIGNKEDSTIARTTVSADATTVSWIDDFRQFREAVYKGDVKETEAYFTFPIIDSTNDIWYLAQDSEPGSNAIIPFTEKDFVKYFKKIFPPEFINSLLKIKTEDLYEKGKIETETLIKDSLTNYSMDATFDRSDNSVTLIVNSNTTEKDDEGNIQDGGEFSMIYIFTIQKNGHLLFNKIQLAG